MSEEFLPYGPWRRWVRALRAHHRRRRSGDGAGNRPEADPGDRIYLAYGFTLLALMYGPILWSAVSQAGAPLGEAGSSDVRGALIEAGAVVIGLAGLAGVFVARLGAPVWITATDAAYSLSGIWDPRVVLWRRIGVLVLAMAVVAALVGSALAAGALGAAAQPVGVVGLLAWAGCAAGVAQLPLALAVAAQCPRWRAVARGVAVTVAVIGVLVAVQGTGLVDGACLVPEACPDPVVQPGPPAVAVGWAAVLMAGCTPLLFAVLPRHLDADTTAAAWGRTVSTGVAVSAGDSGGVRTVAGATPLRARGVSFPGLLVRWLPLVARDVLGLRRRAGAVVTSTIAGVAGVVLVGVAADGGPGAVLAAVGGGLVLYAASATWAGGLRDMAEQSDPAGLLPGGPRRAALAHLPVPAGVAVLVGVLGLLVAQTLVGVDASSVVACAAALTTVLGARVWVAGATQAPPELYTPMSGPAGDMSMVVVGGWFLRGWLAVVGLLWLLVRFGTPTAVTVVMVAAWLAFSGLRRIGRS